MMYAVCCVCAQIDWNKGSAVRFILDALGLTEAENICPVYLGDDLSDEDAFLAVKSLSHPGISVLVREDNDAERPAETNAIYKLRNPDEVEVFLRRLVEMKEVHTAAHVQTAEEVTKGTHDFREIHIHGEGSIVHAASSTAASVTIDAHIHCNCDHMSLPSAALPVVAGTSVMETK